MKQTILNAETLELELVELKNETDKLIVEKDKDKECSIDIHENQLELDFD